MSPKKFLQVPYHLKQILFEAAFLYILPPDSMFQLSCLLAGICLGGRVLAGIFLEHVFFAGILFWELSPTLPTFLMVHPLAGQR